VLPNLRQFTGGWVSGIGSGIGIAQLMREYFDIAPEAVGASLLAVISVAGVMIASRGKLTFPPGGGRRS
jgi:hypothetical protein